MEPEKVEAGDVVVITHGEFTGGVCTVEEVVKGMLALRTGPFRIWKRIGDVSRVRRMQQEVRP